MSFAEAAGIAAGMAGMLLGWRPQEFWAATPAELCAVLNAMAGHESAGIGTADLARLKERFPDG